MRMNVRIARQREIWYNADERVAERMQKQQDLTTGSIWRKMVAFAVPIFFGNLFQQLYNTVDALIVGNLEGQEALAAVSSSGTMIFLIVGFFSGIFIGAGVVIARYYGAKDVERVEKAMHTDVAFGIAAGLILTIVGVLLTPSLLRIIDTPEDVMPNSVAYFRMYFFGAMGMVLYNVCVGIMQAMGDSKHPLYSLIFSSVVNVMLDLLFVGKMGMGVSGAALATVISQSLSAMMCLWRLMRKSPILLRLREIRFHREMLEEILRMGIPSGIQNSIIALANIVVQSNINGFGKAAMAGCGSYSKIEGFAFLPVTCFAMALSTFISQNLGAKQYGRAKQGAAFGTICGVLMAWAIGVAFFLFAPRLIAMFNGDPDVLAYGVRQARTASLFYGLLAFSHCAAGILRGAGKSTVPMFVMLACWCIIRITYITVAMHFFPYIQTIFWAYPITWTLSSVVFSVYLWRSDWLHAFERAGMQRFG